MGNRNAIKVLTIIALSIFAIPVLLLLYRMRLFKTRNDIFNDFLQDNSPEALQADVLILAGRRPEDIAIRALRDTGSQKRRYIMVYLTAIHSVKAVPILKLIVADTKEPDYIRFEALQALRSLDTASASCLAANVSNTGGMHGELGSDIVRKRARPPRVRTFMDAFLYRDN